MLSVCESRRALSVVSLSNSSSASQRSWIGVNDQRLQVEQIAHSRPRPGSYATRRPLGKCSNWLLGLNGVAQTRQRVYTPSPDQYKEVAEILGPYTHDTRQVQTSSRE